MRKDYITWDEYFMGIAHLAAERSKDPNSLHALISPKMIFSSLTPMANFGAPMASVKSANQVAVSALLRAALNYLRKIMAITFCRPQTQIQTPKPTI